MHVPGGSELEYGAHSPVRKVLQKQLFAVALVPPAIGAQHEAGESQEGQLGEDHFDTMRFF